MLRLQKVEGYSNRVNNILFTSGALSDEKKQHVVFFPGDVQNYRSQMASHYSNKKWTPWCYENTANLLASQFPNAWIWLIEPTTMHDKIFSCYDNFITGNLLGAPECFENHEALRHLSLLLRSAVDTVNGYLDGVENDNVCKLDTSTCKDKDTKGFSQNKILLDLPLSLIGFSKGCVVLNQFLFELKEAEKVDELNSFVQRITTWYWLDGGHSKDFNTWITDEDILKDLAKLKTEVTVLVTPYQMKDMNRIYIGEEERTFVDTLKRFGCEVKEKLYFEDEERSLENHFKVLEKISDSHE